MCFVALGCGVFVYLVFEEEGFSAVKQLSSLFASRKRIFYLPYGLVMNLDGKQLVHCGLHLSFSKHNEKEVSFVFLVSKWETEAEVNESDLPSVVATDRDRRYLLLSLR